MKIYRVSLYDEIILRTIEASRTSGKSIWIADFYFGLDMEFRHPRISKFFAYFDTIEEAIEYLGKRFVGKPGLTNQGDKIQNLRESKR